MIATRLVSPTLQRFLLVGGVSYLVNQAMLALLYDAVLSSVDSTIATPFGAASVSLLVASLVAVEISILVRFLLNDSWTFAGRCADAFWPRLWRSNVSSLASPVIALACVNVLTPVFGVSYLIANSIGVVLGLGWNWAWSSRVVWRVATEPASNLNLKESIDGYR